MCVRDEGGASDVLRSQGCVVLFSINPLTGNRTVVEATHLADEYDSVSQETRQTLTPLLNEGPVVLFSYSSVATVPSHPALPYDPIQVGIPLPEWFGLLVEGFLFGVFYMKGKYDGRVVQA